MASPLRVALLSPPFSILTYTVPPRFQGWELPRGLRVAVPMGNSLRAGVILGVEDTPPEGIALKDILWPLELAPLLNGAYVELAENLAARQMSGVGQVLSTLLPAGLKTSQAQLTWREGGKRRKLPLNRLGDATAQRLEELATAWRGGEVELALAAMDRDQTYRLQVDPPWPVRPAATAQLAVLECLFTRGQATATQLREALGPSITAALSTLEAKGHIILGPPPEEPEETATFDAPVGRPPLTPEQQAACDALLPLLANGQGGERLIHGVTGSGKTRLYFELAEACLKSGRSVLLLAPEVALASALRSRARAWFGFDPVYSHGYQTPARRERTYRDAAMIRTPTLVVGTRSALFLPLRDLGLIILDEEHDASFKQDERMTYQAKEVAYFRARQDSALLLLGSATPDVKTFHAAREGLTPMLSLEHRAGPGTPPEIELVDLAPRDKAVQLSRKLDKSGAGLLAAKSLAELHGAVERGEQAMILLNRRGYAPLLFCLDCEQVVKCPSCEVSLTYHKGRERLVCHYCGQSYGFPSPCGKCGGCNFLPMGEGTEMLAEQLSTVLPADVPIGRLDRDIARRAGRAEAILAEFEQGKTRVLVGTQMLSKGHHFPDVTLVIVADGDVGLNFPDYRAAERAFQMLVQVAGRAGRGDLPGKVLIQTRNPLEPFWNFVLNADYHGFFDLELAKRLKYSYPPFVKLGLVRASYPRQWEHGPEALALLAAGLRATGGVRVLGPAPAPITMVRDRLRFHCLLKAPDWRLIRNAFAEAAHRVGRNSKLRLQLDLDPLDML